MLPSESIFVQRLEARRHAADAGPGLESLQIVGRFLDDRPDIPEIPLDIVVDGGVNPALGHVDELIDIGPVIERSLENLVCGGNQLPLDALLLQDLDVVFHVSRSGNPLRQGDKGKGASDLVKLAHSLELLTHGQQIQGDVLIDELRHRLEYCPVPGFIKAVRLKLLHHVLDAIRIYQKGSEHGFLEIDGLRRLVSQTCPKIVNGGLFVRLLPGLFSFRHAAIRPPQPLLYCLR